MRKIIAIVIVLLCSCQSYPRYNSMPPVTPKENVPTRERYSTNEFLKLGSILRKYLGKPYIGSSRYETGVDCSMFTRDVFRTYNKMELPRTAAEQYEMGKEIPHGRMIFGDLVFFRTERGKKITHVGIYIGDNEFIHASSTSGVIISNLSEKYWGKAYAAGRRILE